MPEMIVVALLLVSLSALFHIVPGLTRPDLFFAVTVAPEFRRTLEAQRILRRFRTIVWIPTFAAIALELATGLVLIALLIQCAGYLWALVSAHHSALAFGAAPASIVAPALAAPHEKLPGGLVVASLPIGSLVALGAWAELNWERLPPRFPVHWGFHGPDSWVVTTPVAVFGLLTLHACLCLFLGASAWGLLNWSRRISTFGPRATAEHRFRHRIVELLILTEYFVACPAFFALLQLPATAVNVWGLVLMVTILGFAISLIPAGQGGTRKGVATDAAPAGDRTPDACWKWGLVYFNPKDPSIFIEKRFGIGYTINFGNRWSWVVAALTLIPLAVGLIGVGLTSRRA